MYVQNPGPAMYPSHPQTYSMPRSSPKPYQPLGENNGDSMIKSYQVAPYQYSYPYPHYTPTPHHMTHPQMAQYIPYNIIHPQSMSQVPQNSSFSHPMTQLNTVPQAPQCTSPYQYPLTHPQTKTQMPRFMMPPPYYVPHPQTETQRPQYMMPPSYYVLPPQTETQRPQVMMPPPYSVTPPQTVTPNPVYTMSPPYCETPPQTVPNSKVDDLKIKDKNLMTDSKILQCSENSSNEVSESSSSEDENSERDNNDKSEELNNESNTEHVSDDASGAKSLKDVKIEEKIGKITRVTTDTKKSGKLEEENYSLTSKCTRNKTSKKKKQKQKNKSVVKDEGSCISKEASPVTSVSQSTENKKELKKLKDGKDFLVQYEAVITEVHCTMGKLQTQSGAEYYFAPALCFLYGVSLAHIELWHVLIEGQQVKVTLDLTTPAHPKITRVTVKEKNPDHDTTTTVLDLEKWCSTNSVPEKATSTLIEQVKGLHDS